MATLETTAASAQADACSPHADETSPSHTGPCINTTAHRANSVLFQRNHTPCPSADGERASAPLKSRTFISTTPPRTPDFGANSPPVHTKHHQNMSMQTPSPRAVKIAQDVKIIRPQLFFENDGDPKSQTTMSDKSLEAACQTLRLRLKYAHFKVERGWEHLPFATVKQLLKLELDGAELNCSTTGSSSTESTTMKRKLRAADALETDSESSSNVNDNNENNNDNNNNNNNIESSPEPTLHMSHAHLNAWEALGLASGIAAAKRDIMKEIQLVSRADIVEAAVAKRAAVDTNSVPHCTVAGLRDSQAALSTGRLDLLPAYHMHFRRKLYPNLSECSTGVWDEYLDLKQEYGRVHQDSYGQLGTPLVYNAALVQPRHVSYRPVKPRLSNGSDFPPPASPTMPAPPRRNRQKIWSPAPPSRRLMPVSAVADNKFQQIPANRDRWGFAPHSPPVATAGGHHTPVASPATSPSTIKQLAPVPSQFKLAPMATPPADQLKLPPLLSAVPSPQTSLNLGADGDCNGVPAADFKRCRRVSLLDRPISMA